MTILFFKFYPKSGNSYHGGHGAHGVVGTYKSGQSTQQMTIILFVNALTSGLSVV